MVIAEIADAHSNLVFFLKNREAGEAG